MSVKTITKVKKSVNKIAKKVMAELTKEVFAIDRPYAVRAEEFDKELGKLSAKYGISLQLGLRDTKHLGVSNTETADEYDEDSW